MCQSSRCLTISILTSYLPLPVRSILGGKLVVFFWIDPILGDFFEGAIGSG